MASTATERSQRARIAALTNVAQQPSGSAMTSVARRRFRDSFLDGHQCDLCGTFTIEPGAPDAERQRRADAAYKLHMTRLSHKARISRARAAGLAEAASRYEAELQQLGDGQAAADAAQPV